MALAQRSAQENHLGGGHGAIDVVGNGEVCRHYGHLAHLAKGAHKLEARGARIHENGLARLHKRCGNASDGAFGLNVHVDAQVLNRHREGARERDRAAVRAAQLAVAREGVEVCSRGDA